MKLKSLVFMLLIVALSTHGALMAETMDQKQENVFVVDDGVSVEFELAREIAVLDDSFQSLQFHGFLADAAHTVKGGPYFADNDPDTDERKSDKLISHRPRDGL